MTRWPLKLKVGVYSAVLSVLALLGAAAVILPFVYHREVQAVEPELVAQALESVGLLYAIEAHGREQQLPADAKLRCEPRPAS